MDVVGLFGIAALVSAAICGAVIASLIADVLQRGARTSWLQQRAGAGKGIDRILSGNISLFAKPVQVLLRLGLASKLFDRLSLALRACGRESNRESLCCLFIQAALFLFLIGCLLGSPLAGLAFSACIIIVASAWSNHVLERNRDLIREALPDAIRAMGACFHAGFSLQQTFRQLSEELQGPISVIFSKARDALETGSSAKEALASIRESSIVPELSFIAVSLEVQHKAGGSLKQALDAACESLEGELELRRSLKTQTAQARLSARVVTGVTIALVGVLSLLTEDFLAPFFSSALGLAMLVCAVGMQVAGIVIVRKLLRVEVD